MKTLLHLLTQNTAKGEVIPAAEAFVLLTLGFFAGMVMAVAFGAFILYRRANRPKPHHQLLMELNAENESIAQHTAPSQTHSWAQDADWWKRPS